MAASTPPLNVFYAYANEDKLWQERLRRQLIILQLQGLIIEWHEENVSAGAIVEQEIKKHLDAADLVLLLLSSDFLASPFYISHILDEVLERHQRGKTVIIPILLRPVDVTRTPLSKLLMLPRDNKPITSWSNADEALLDVAQGIGTVIEELHAASASRKPSSPGASHSKPVWNVPYRRNPFFTGRERLLARLRAQLTATNAAALTQAQAISGLGGIGKTQTALEYAYRYREEYRAVLWVSASSRETLLTGLVGIASLLDLPVSQEKEKDQTLVLSVVKRWLADNEGWLLIVDNADDVDVVKDLLPEGAGHILLTTREQSLGIVAQGVEVKTMDREEGMILVLRRAKILAPGVSLEQVPEEQRVRAAAIVDVMDGLPLALDQAGAYIEETGCSLSNYLKMFQEHEVELLNRRGKRSPDYPYTVATTWTMSFEQVEQQNPAAADLLRLCAFLDPDAIPEDLLTEGAFKLGPTLGPTAADPFKLNEALNVLRSYSLIRRTSDTSTLTIHRLVQAVLINGLTPRSRKLWARRAVQAVNQAFPDTNATTWEQCRRYLPHTLACARLIEDFQLLSAEAANLLNRMGWYLDTHAHYAEAELVLQRAITIYEHIVGDEHPDTSDALNNLGRLYQDQGRYQEAEPLLRRSLAIKEKVLNPAHPAIIATLNNLGLLYLYQKRYREAELLLLRALDICEGLDPVHPDTGITLNNLGLLYREQGRYQEAEPILLHALGSHEKMLGPEHPETSTTLAVLATLYRDQGRYQEAEPLFLRSLTISEKVLGPEHPETSIILANLATLYQDQGRYEEAEPLFLRSLAIREKVLGHEHPNTGTTLFNLATLYQEQGNYEQAETLYQSVIHIDEKVFGPDHIEVAVDLEGYASLLREMDRDEEAEALEERARAIGGKQAV